MDIAQALVLGCAVGTAYIISTYVLYRFVVPAMPKNLAIVLVGTILPTVIAVTLILIKAVLAWAGLNDHTDMMAAESGLCLQAVLSIAIGYQIAPRD